MIYNVPLTPEQQHRSQRYYYYFNLINGFSYMCLGETLMILLAVKVDAPDTVVAMLGAMTYFGFLLLPLGKLFTAWWGAVKTQVMCWVFRNIAALLVASSAVFYSFGMHSITVALILIGAFLFYGFRSAGVVMSQPLCGEISTEKDRGPLLAYCNAIFFASSLIALLVITWLLKKSDSVWMLMGIIIVGASCGIFASTIFNHVDETETLRQSARDPLKKDFKVTMSSESLRRQICAGFAMNLGIILVIPLIWLVLKRGYHITDGQVLKFALIQFGSSSLFSLTTGKLSTWIGPRRVILYSFITVLLLVPIMYFAPEHYYPAYFIAPFIMAGAAFVSSSNAATHYFLQNVTPEKRVAMSIFLSLFTSAGSGLVGMIITTCLLKLSNYLMQGYGTMAGYRLYFVMAGLLMLPGIWLIYRLTPLTIEQRRNILKK